MHRLHNHRKVYCDGRKKVHLHVCPLLVQIFYAIIQNWKLIFVFIMVTGFIMNFIFNKTILSQIYGSSKSDPLSYLTYYIILSLETSSIFSRTNLFNNFKKTLQSLFSYLYFTASHASHVPESDVCDINMLIKSIKC